MVVVGGWLPVSPSYRSLDGGVGQVIWEGAEKTTKKKSLIDGEARGAF